MNSLMRERETMILRNPHLPAETGHRTPGRGGVSLPLPGRVKLLATGGFWRTEVGTLNQIIHIWPLRERRRARPHPRQAVATKVWPPKIAGVRPRDGDQDPASRARSRRISSRASTAASTSSAPIPTGPATSPKVIEAWTPRISERAPPLSPLIFAGYHRHRARSTSGFMSGPTRTWASASALRASAMKPGSWPPPRSPSVTLHRQQSTFAIPAKFSPPRRGLRAASIVFVGR